MNRRADLNQSSDDPATLVAGHPGNSLRDAAQSISDQVSQTIDSATRTGRDLANTASQSASSLTATLEDFGRRNPLGAMGTAFLIGMVFGLVRRGGR